MQVTIANNPQEMQITTISLVPNNTDDLFLFHCINCGQGIAQHQGKVAKIYPILEPDEAITVISACRKCAHRYTFQTTKYFKMEFTKVILRSELMQQNAFYCHMGRGEPMLIFDASRVYSKVEQKQMTLPFVSHCIDPRCKELYYFAEIV